MGHGGAAYEPGSHDKGRVRRGHSYRFDELTFCSSAINFKDCLYTEKKHTFETRSFSVDLIKQIISMMFSVNLGNLTTGRLVQILNFHLVEISRFNFTLNTTFKTYR